MMKKLKIKMKLYAFGLDNKYGVKKQLILINHCVNRFSETQ